MYKLLKQSFFLLILAGLAFTSCEGRITKSQALSEDIDEFNRTVTVEIPVFKPESYMEREIDTVMQNGYRVKIKTYTDMEHTVLFTKIKDTINYQTHYRNFKFSIAIEKNGQRVFNELFDKRRINQLFEFNANVRPEISGFEEFGILKSIEFNDDLSNSEQIEIDIIYAIPNSDKSALYTMTIDDNGRMSVDYKYQI